ncbi:MAG: cupin domain-containing protein [Chloroflexi bacterium]|nr:cupin domain-containing protein [Chloroflexota bacterium]
MRDNIIQINKWNRPEPPTEEDLRRLMVAEGLTPYRWSNQPDDVYAAHEHSYFKVIYVVSGSITFGFPIDGEPAPLSAGDRLNLPAGVRHNAVVGPTGVVCLEAIAADLPND